ncbi:hypothetical protein NUACC26_001500 [Scytonema sp. NUACC26]
MVYTQVDLPPLIPPMDWGETQFPVPSPIHREGKSGVKHKLKLSCTDSYLARLGVDFGWLIIFDQRSKAPLQR